MTMKLIMPKSGMGTSEGTIARWLIAEGDAFTKGDVIVEVETAKAVEEVEAPIDGILRKILLAEGETAEVHSDIALLEEKEE